MSKCKFKVGDKVRIVKNVWLDGSNRDPVGIGEICTIRACNPTSPYPYHMDRYYGWAWRDDELELVEQPKIVITTDGAKYVTAKLYEGDTVKVAEAKCAPEDTFDFKVGARLAVSRLIGTPIGEGKNKVPKYYSGKVVCVGKSIRDNDFTVGKVYEITDGKFIDNKGSIRPAIDERVIDLNDLINGEYFGNWHYKFIPFVED